MLYTNKKIDILWFKFFLKKSFYSFSFSYRNEPLIHDNKYPQEEFLVNHADIYCTCTSIVYNTLIMCP